MTTYASPRLTKYALQALISLLFIFGCYMLFISTISMINYVGHRSRLQDDPYHDDQQMDSISLRFPNISSPSVQLMFSLLTFVHGMFGIVSITKEQTSMISTYGYILFISCFTKLLFIIASLMMMQTIPPAETVASESNHSSLTSVSLLIILTSMLEIILVMFVCQFRRLIKLGDAARQEIQSIHSYHLERRSRSRSQSRFRSILDNNINNNMSRQVSMEPSMMFTNFNMAATPSYQDDDSRSFQSQLPPPIYLKLDR